MKKFIPIVMVIISSVFLVWLAAQAFSGDHRREPKLVPVDCGPGVDGRTGQPLVCCRMVRAAQGESISIRPQ